MIEHIEAHMQRKMFAILKKDDFEDIPDDRIVEVVFDHLNLKVKDDYANEFQIVGSWSLGQQAIYQIWWMEAEVNNGGFIQFFDNSSGQFAPLLPDSLRLVGATQFADLMQRANLRYEAYQKDLSAGNVTEDDWFESMNDLDTAFYACYDAESLADLQATYIRRNTAAFVDG